MKAVILAIGSELLTPSRMDTNSLYLTSQLNQLGVEVVAKYVIGDDRARITRITRLAAAEADLLLFSGGLGPTEDDLTREAVAEAFGRSLTCREELREELERVFGRLKRRMSENNLRQTFLIEGAEALGNPNGTAPGQYLSLDGKAVVLLPGPPKELEPMFENHVLPRLRDLLPAQVLRVRRLRVAGMGESDLDHLIAPVYRQFENPVTTVLAAVGDIQIFFQAAAQTEEEAEALLDRVERPVLDLLGDRVYSRAGDSLEQVVGSLLRQRGETLSVAESCTGGMLAQRITDVPGSSDYFLGGFVTYTNQLKIDLLGVDAGMIDQHTAVSEPVARAMAEGANARTGSDWSVAVTGIAGPGGGTEATPVGTVYVAVAGPGGVEVRRMEYFRDRARVRSLAVQMALDWLRRRLQANP